VKQSAKQPLYISQNYQKQALIDSSFLELYEQTIAEARLLVLRQALKTTNVCSRGEAGG
jgi:hypothetical protein